MGANRGTGNEKEMERGLEVSLVLKSEQGCLKDGCTLQTAVVTEQCVGNTRYINRQQFELQHGACRPPKEMTWLGDQGQPGSHSTPAPGPAQMDLCRSLHTAQQHASLTAPGHRHGPEVLPSASDLSKCEEHLPASVSPGMKIKGKLLFCEGVPDHKGGLREQQAAACTAGLTLPIR